jgi:hypothetical protein
MSDVDDDDDNEENGTEAVPDALATGAAPVTPLVSSAHEAKPKEFGGPHTVEARQHTLDNS